MSRTELRQPLLAVIAALALAVALTWPVALHPSSMLVGHPGNDAWNHAWGYWWVGQALESGQWPGFTRLLAWPDGGTLYFIDTAQVLLSLPLQLIGGPALAYNAVMGAGLALAGFGAWLLARRLTGDGAAAAVALFLYEATPHLLGQAHDGISETVCAGWIPLTLWALMRLMDRATWGRAVTLGVSAGLCAITSWYHGLFTALAAALLLGWTAAFQPYLVDWRRLVTRLPVAVVIAGVLFAPLFLAFSGSLDATDALVGRDPDFVWNSLLKHNITDLLAFFSLTTTPSPDLHALYGEDLLIVVHLGWVGLLLSGAALVLTRRRLGAWVWVAATSFLLSLGPFLNVGGHYVTVSGHRVPLPFLAVFEALPVFDRISHPFRFASVVALCLALLAAHGVRHVLRRRSARGRLVAATALGLLALAETTWASPAPVPVRASDARIPAAYTAMGQDPQPGAVLDLPLTVPNLERGVYTWYQSQHRRPVPWGLNDPMPAALLRNRLIATLIRVEASRARMLAPRLPELDLVVSARALARQGYRYVVVHEDWYPGFKRDKVVAILGALFGEPQAWPDDALLVYTVPECAP